MASNTQGRRRVLIPGEAEPPIGFYENRSHRPSNHTKLRATERIYKNKRCSISDWPELLDLGGEEVPSSTNAVSVQVPPGSCFAWKPDGCVRVCSFDCAPGLYVMPNSLSVLQQQELAIHAYTTLAHPQYDCSLQSTVCLPTEHTLFHHWRDSLRTGCPASSGCSTAATSSGDPAESNGSVRSRLKPLPQDAAGIEQVLRRLRWTVLGYRYDWSSLSYDWGQEPQPLPTCITRVANDAVELLQQHPVALQCGIFKPQAAVVNFYQVGDSLTSHVDRSEPAAGAPLVSLSLGCPAVFLFGGETRDDDALALLLRSGDVLVMVENARRCFHGVPRVLHSPHALSPTSMSRYSLSSAPLSSLPCGNTESNPRTDSFEWHLVQQLLEKSRININIRQVEA